MNNTSVIAERLAAQQLSGARARRPEAVVHGLLAVQAQDARAARLTIGSRSTGLSATDVDDALTERKSLVITWLNRGTLHLVESGDYWWLHPLTAPQIAPMNQRRLLQEGVSTAQADRGVDVVAVARPRRAWSDARHGTRVCSGVGVAGGSAGAARTARCVGAPRFPISRRHGPGRRA